MIIFVAFYVWTRQSMINKKREGGFYASKVRLFLNEYDGIPLEKFCKTYKVSYSKMLNCFGRSSCQYHPVGKPKSDKPIKVVAPDMPLLPFGELMELVVDQTDGKEKNEEELSNTLGGCGKGNVDNPCCLWTP